MWIVVALAGTGCNQLLGIDDLTRIDGGGGAVDAAPIDSFDSPPAMTCAMLIAPAKCFPSATGMGAVTIVGAVNTSAGAGGDSRCVSVLLSTGPELCAIIGDTIAVPSSGATITGTRPLLLLASTTITVTGVLDASSSIEGTARTGPGSADPPSCTLPTESGNGNDGHGGGAGGSFITSGGDGGDGAGQQGRGGANAATALVTTDLRAGCRGSTGGGGTGGGVGGAGGGAIYLVAGTEIVINNRVVANGAGGAGATSIAGGGGGGGAGGMIALDAPTVTLTGAAAQVSANGAGGGEGTFSSTARKGNESTVWNVAAAGGNGGSAPGGAGGAGSVLAGEGADASDGSTQSGNEGGGGGGGGGGGLVWLKGTPGGPQAAQISPPYVAK